ncbi:DUF4846 domain-containing protein [Mucilaginibacter lappiensis]|uniref:DUF4846 domain-containing protein n=1 Tax=Mucilaginibacter lappiensis TaxID=354630 RepID=A0A1N7G5R3_9SPHI|nr:DUF4846 domain-containing protein [Mucilaginibacter lappiensis]MBB6112868.1 hypothetical protein [Mucilaginibacter lappiensis]MBB6131429.1 hypothetical protein [Mucilaginibacter lappiensis]SIS07901.1 protein of unknown function (4846) [Mucilaginibacter lappiensis]
MKSILLLLSFLLAGSAKTDNVLSRFKTPASFRQEAVLPGTFGAWLLKLPLKPVGTPARTYKGDIARTNLYTAAIVDMSVGTQDLQQCADAVMRLRGEYLYQQKNYKAIAFNFTSGFKCDFVHYADGYRYSNNHWVLKAKKDYSYPNFLRYMNLVFSYAGTLSLQKELKKVNNPDQLKTGDVFIRGGSPGHCFVVLDVVEDARHYKKFLLAQSFMPAQNIQVLQDNGDPWFSLERKSSIPYGELISKDYLKRFD